MRTEIFIENIGLDLNGDISSEFSYAIDDIKDFASRNTNYSKTIVIPGNSINNKIFGHVFNFGSANPYNPILPNVGINFNASKGADCIIYVDKIQIFKGVLRLLEIVIDKNNIEYECVVFGELGGFVSALGNAKIEELDFSAYNHNWNFTQAVYSWDQPSGYFYPIIDYGNCSVNKHDWDFKALRPCLYVKDYIDKILSFSGYTYESNFFNTDLFKRLIIPPNVKQLLKSTSKLVDGNASAGTIITVSVNSSSKVSFNNYQIANFTATQSNSRFTYIGTDVLNTTVFVNLQGQLQVNITGTATIVLTMRLYKNATAISIKTQNYIYNGFQNFFGFQLTDTLVTQINQNEFFEVELSCNITLNPGSTFNNGSIVLYVGKLLIESTTTVIAPLQYNDPVNMNNTIPKGIFMRDFFASIVKMFNLYVIEDRNKTKHLKIEPFITFYIQDLSLLDHGSDLFLVNNTDFLLLSDQNVIVRDWTYKIDRSKPMRLRPMSELNGRYFEFKYKQDNDYYNEQYQKKFAEGYGDIIVDTGYEFAKDKQTAEIIFAATPLVGYTGEDKIYSTIMKITAADTIPKTEDSTEHVIRILQRKKVTGVTSYNIKNGNTILNGYTLTDYGYAGHLDDPDLPNADINFGSPKELFFQNISAYPSANLFNGFWSEYVAEISDKDSRLLICNARLNEMDIFNLDFSYLIYIDGSLFRLNKINDYNPKTNETTKIELLKVIELTYQ